MTARAKAPAVAVAPPKPASATTVLTVKMSGSHVGMIARLVEHYGCNQSEILRLAVERLFERLPANRQRD